jgi:hypothetical protein
LLEQVFEAPLDVDIGPEGRPRVHIRGTKTSRPEKFLMQDKLL